jgi:hypothetical protein
MSIPTSKALFVCENAESDMKTKNIVAKITRLFFDTLTNDLTIKILFINNF